LVIVTSTIAAGGVTDTRAGVIVLGVFAGLVVMSYPAVSLIAIATVCQELTTTSTGHAASLFAFGHQVYFTNVGRLPLIFWASTCAAAGAFARWADAGMPRLTGSSLIPKLVLLLALLAVLLSVADHGTLLRAFGQDGRPFLLLYMSWFVAATLEYQRGGRQRFRQATFWALSVAAALGLADLYFRRGQGLSVGLDPTNTSAQTLNRFLLFYDSALPALAGAVLLAVLLRRTQWKALAPIAVVAGWITIFSFRRSVWISLPIVLATLFIFGKQRIRMVGRVLLPLAVVIAALQVADPGLTREISNRFASAVSAVAGNTASNDASTAGHVSDIHQGWAYATSKPLRGWGPDVSQLPNLVVPVTPGSRLYLHDEYLMDWIRFGLPGVTLVLTLVLALGYRAVRVLRRAGGHSLDQVSAAVFLLVYPICCVTAPFLTTTNRWPILIGLAGGLVCTTPLGAELDGIAQDTRVTVEPFGNAVLPGPRQGGQAPVAVR
jgi:O-antigen ligase